MFRRMVFLKIEKNPKKIEKVPKAVLSHVSDL